MNKPTSQDHTIEKFTSDKCKRCGEEIPRYREDFCTQKCRKIWKNPSPFTRA